MPASLLASLKKNADDFESREVFGGAPADMTRIEILRGRGRLVFARKKGVWWLAEPIADLADAGEIDRLAASLLRLRVKDFVHGAQDLAALGLNPPLFRVSITGAKAAVTAVDFGATRSDGNTIYARRDGQVFTLERDVLEELSKEAEAFRARALLGFRPGRRDRRRRRRSGRRAVTRSSRRTAGGAPTAARCWPPRPTTCSARSST